MRPHQVGDARERGRTSQPTCTHGARRVTPFSREYGSATEEVEFVTRSQLTGTGRFALRHVRGPVPLRVSIEVRSMPIYEYRCRKCHKRFSVLTLRVSEKPVRSATSAAAAPPTACCHASPCPSRKRRAWNRSPTRVPSRRHRRERPEERRPLDAQDGQGNGRGRRRRGLRSDGRRDRVRRSGDDGGETD